MDSKGFFLGLLAAVVLFLLWKRESGGMNFSFAGLIPATGAGDAAGGCAGCGSGTGCAGCGASPSAAASPASQGGLSFGGGFADGFITPGTPPLQTAVGSGSFYAASGPTPDSSFTNFPAKPVSTSPTKVGPSGSGSQTTAANTVPPRAVQQVPTYSNQGFVSRYNVAGVPRTILRTNGYIQ